ncbi:deoxynucleoside kinase [Fructilactobacillus fructivorans]|uniref:AAA family ATPase n=1 Tax=Fructilactobacillus fructivorans TaxID=1614 RepID=A0AAE6P010_9LACO|nr:deoxynucleoside kinase [Fructilactobacillus fructivorans]KRK57130.1 deoxynucleoside kinase [Fructilactobacillus fructivorans]KRN40374.1 deoxynucleoside kinase [Fructilactobacillus fructivorans]KRN42071.1 deoxynucleoside kinase [Fructilactobacillus fructivorans]QFX92380.1 AAA family ATPase [Fructilactobacillus fructivorans]RDV64932.1 deoxynucleoside kinase [Fructilactobacillus fructivorans]
MIVLSGTIGAGKTTLTTLLAERLNSPAYYESVDDNKILPLFYKDPKKYAFLLQIYFLNKRLDSIKEASTNKYSVMDRSIFEDSLLFHLNADLGRATETEVQIYDSLLKNMMEPSPGGKYQKTPDLLIYIDISFSTMLKRIKKRGRDYEQIDNDSSLYEYYRELNQRYATWYKNYDLSPKIKINGDKYDFVEDPNAREKVLKTLSDKIQEVLG